MEELDSKPVFDVPAEPSFENSTPFTPLELVATGPSTGAHFEVYDSSSETKQMVRAVARLGVFLFKCCLTSSRQYRMILPQSIPPTEHFYLLSTD